MPTLKDIVLAKSANRKINHNINIIMILKNIKQSL